MKKTILYIATLGFSLTALAQQKIIFKGAADTMYNGSTIMMYNRPLGVLDSAKVSNGGFTFTVPYKEPSRYMFYSKYEAKKKGGYAPWGIIVTSPGTVTIKADMESLAKSVVGNAPETALYLAFATEGNQGKQMVMDKLNEKFGADVIKNLKKTDTQYDAVMKYYEELSNDNGAKETARLEKFIKANPNSFSAIYVLSGMANNLPVAKLEAFYQMLGAGYKSTSYSTGILNKIEAAKITAIGKIAPDFEQPDTAGKLVKLSNFKGQYVLVDFWASWCGPCRAENPNVVKAYQKYHDKGFTVLGVSLDQPGKKEAWLKAIHHDNLTWTQVSDLQFWDNKVAKLYGIQAIPQNYLLDKEGKIIAVSIRGEDLDKKLSEIFHN